ncbi:hypothetical protein Y1Q_0009145 [Alligator mississippiensis]|uniref:ribonuclease H n=1 Tax=Alligator mississippiensis TaxID=8496 RepID=A0A151M2E5_ALLMI|nr:hypothetical protein Y1Q_0009145 [Alligator mississippiensis]
MVEGFAIEMGQGHPEEAVGREVDVAALWEDEHFQLEQSRETDFRHALHEHLVRRDDEVLRPELMKPDELDLGPSLTEESGPGDVDLASRLSKDQREQAAELIREFADVFQEMPGEAWGVVHRIKTPPGQVIRESWRRIPQKLQNQIKAEIEMMLEKGVICRSHSDWRSPIVVVPKPEGKIRLCIDFRKVNVVVKFDAYPMPRVDELVENIGQACYISTLDLTKGYWQVPVAPEDQEKTAFATPWGHFQFRRILFGLHGVAATFE